MTTPASEVSPFVVDMVAYPNLSSLVDNPTMTIRLLPSAEADRLFALHPAVFLQTTFSSSSPQLPAFRVTMFQVISSSVSSIVEITLNTFPYISPQGSSQTAIAKLESPGWGMPRLRIPLSEDETALAASLTVR